MDHNDAPSAVSDASSPAHREPDDDGRSRRHWILAATVVAAVAVDQLTKAGAVDALSSGPVHVGFLHLRLVANRGLLMGILPAPLIVVAAATMLVLWFAVRAARHNETRVTVALGLLAGGALGNFVDRILQRQQFPDNAVVDWLSLGGGMTFNLADVALLVGVLMLLAPSQSARATSSPVSDR